MRALHIVTVFWYQYLAVIPRSFKHMHELDEIKASGPFFAANTR
jgi:hypothetical protein